MKVEVLGFDEMKDFYESHPDFLRCGESAEHQHWINRVSLLIISLRKVCCSKDFISSYREDLLEKEKHSGELAGHFGIDKILNLLKEKYYWL